MAASKSGARYMASTGHSFSWDSASLSPMTSTWRAGVAAGGGGRRRRVRAGAGRRAGHSGCVRRRCAAPSSAARRRGRGPGGRAPGQRAGGRVPGPRPAHLAHDHARPRRDLQPKQLAQAQRRLAHLRGGGRGRAAQRRSWAGGQACRSRGGQAAPALPLDPSLPAARPLTTSAFRRPLMMTLLRTWRGSVDGWGGWARARARQGEPGVSIRPRLISVPAQKPLLIPASHPPSPARPLLPPPPCPSPPRSSGSRRPAAVARP